MIAIECAELVSFDQNLTSLGDVLSYRREKNYSVKGRLTNYQNFSGVSGITNQIENQISSLNDYEEIFLNGESFGSGYLTSINYDQGTDVRDKKYSISFVVLEKLDLFNVYGQYYSGVSGIQVEDIHFLENLTESWEFQKTPEQTFEYSRSLNLSLESGVGTNPTQTAKNIANIIFDKELNIPDLLIFYPSYYNSGNKIYSESYDTLNFAYTFSEKFAFQSGDPFIWRYSHSLSKDAGTTTVTEKGSILAAAKPKISSALIGYDGSIVGVFDRCSGVHASYAFVEDIGCPLINSPVSQSISFNEFLGAIDYDVTYSNDNSISTGCITRISHSISSPAIGPSVISEKVEIKGLGKRTYPDNQKYNNAKNCYQNMLLSSGSRISGIASGVNTLCCSGFVPIKFGISDSESEGRIAYSRDYSCDNAFKVPNPFTEVRSSISISEGVPLHQTFKILGYGEEVIGGCRSGNSTLSNISTSVDISSTGVPSLLDFLEFGYDYIQEPETGRCGFISDASYSFSSREKRFNLNVSYDYVKHKELFDRSIG
jgi:hypothetical protein